MMNCCLKGVICDFSEHVLCSILLCCFTVHPPRKVLCELFLCPCLAPILSPHNSAAAARAGHAAQSCPGWTWNDLEMRGLDENCSICFDRGFTFCTVQQYMFHVLGSQPRDFPSFFPVGQDGLNMKHLLWSWRHNRIWYYPGFSQRRADLSLLFCVEHVCKCELLGFRSRKGERQSSDNITLLFKIPPSNKHCYYDEYSLSVIMISCWSWNCTAFRKYYISVALQLFLFSSCPLDLFCITVFVVLTLNLYVLLF